MSYERRPRTARPGATRPLPTLAALVALGAAASGCGERIDEPQREDTTVREHVARVCLEVLPARLAVTCEAIGGERFVRPAFGGAVGSVSSEPVEPTRSVREPGAPRIRGGAAREVTRWEQERGER